MASSASVHDNHLDLVVPVINLAGAIDQDQPEKRKKIVEKIKEASETWGFFQIVNHGVPLSTQDEMTAGVHRFFNQDEQLKKEFFDAAAGTAGKVVLVTTKENWTQGMLFAMAPNPPKPEQLPSCMREILQEYTEEMFKLRDLLLELLSEALGLASNHLKDIDCAEGMGISCNYCPVCPQTTSTELGIGIVTHTDLGFVTVLLQDHVGGLQVLHRDCWVDVPPRQDALVVNLGDMLQLITNDKFISVKHRVLANSVEPRVSVGAFVGSGSPVTTRIYGPLKEFVSKDNPPKYRETTIQNFLAESYKKSIRCNTYLQMLKL